MSDLVDHWPARLADNDDLRVRLLEAYSSPTRGYHDVAHLREVLTNVDLLLRDQPVERDPVVLAAWFHDAVYDGDRDDEERSAALAEEELTRLDVPPALVREVARLVRLTHDHRPAAGDTAGQVLCDADLAILAADEERYAAYVSGVRREYGDLDDATFAQGRAAVLQALVDQPTLFHTELGHREWEPEARANVARELAGLTRRAAP